MVIALLCFCPLGVGLAAAISHLSVTALWESPTPSLSLSSLFLCSNLLLRPHCCHTSASQTAPAPKVLPVISSFDVQGIAKFINGELPYACRTQQHGVGMLSPCMHARLTYWRTALQACAALMRSAEGRAKRIVVMCGAGISVAAGIPDFRLGGGIGLFGMGDQTCLAAVLCHFHGESL